MHTRTKIHIHGHKQAQKNSTQEQNHAWQDKEVRAQQERSQAFSLAAAVSAVAGGHGPNVTHCMAFHEHDSVIYCTTNSKCQVI